MLILLVVKHTRFLSVSDLNVFVQIKGQIYFVLMTTFFNRSQITFRRPKVGGTLYFENPSFSQIMIACKFFFFFKRVIFSVYMHIFREII